MHHLYAIELVRSRLDERLAEADLSAAPVRMRPPRPRHRFGRRRRRPGTGSTA
ncbi:MAG TPA: hypothetical protein VE575_11490 [Acidimicrobiales bacterium]|jgi:hypothetical protein|nr:hypothetical protein [Acidimicrobiales bacterium]